jgi:hypothetical protein
LGLAPRLAAKLGLIATGFHLHFFPGLAADLYLVIVLSLLFIWAAVRWPGGRPRKPGSAAVPPKATLNDVRAPLASALALAAAGTPGRRRWLALTLLSAALIIAGITLSR